MGSSENPTQIEYRKDLSLLLKGSRQTFLSGAFPLS